VRFVPSWFPGAGFQRVASDLGQKLSRIDAVPFNWVKQQIVGFTRTFAFSIVIAP